MAQSLTLLQLPPSSLTGSFVNHLLFPRSFGHGPYSLLHSFVYALIHSFARPITHSPTPMRSLLPSLVDWSTHPLNGSSVHSSRHLLIRPLIPLPVLVAYAFPRSCARSRTSTLSFVRSFAHSPPSASGGLAPSGGEPFCGRRTSTCGICRPKGARGSVRRKRDAFRRRCEQLVVRAARKTL